MHTTNVPSVRVPTQRLRDCMTPKLTLYWLIRSQVIDRQVSCTHETRGLFSLVWRFTAAVSEVGTYCQRPKADAMTALLPDHGRLQCFLTKLLAVGTVISSAFSTCCIILCHHACKEVQLQEGLA